MTVNYVGITLSESNVAGWLAGQTRYYQYADGVSCQTAQATFLALTPAQKVALTTANPPVVPTGNGAWTVRDCATAPVTVTPPATVQNVFRSLAPPTDPNLQNIVLGAYTAATRSYTVVDSANPTPASQGHPTWVWMYLIGGGWKTKMQLERMNLKVFWRYNIEKFLVDPAQPNYQWRSDGSPKSIQTIRYE